MMPIMEGLVPFAKLVYKIFRKFLLYIILSPIKSGCQRFIY